MDLPRVKAKNVCNLHFSEVFVYFFLILASRTVLVSFFSFFIHPFLNSH